MALEPTKLQDYRLFGALGAGATSQVVEAVHLVSGRRVAIKFLATPEEGLADELRERFAREALVLSGLSSRHVGRILGFGFHQGAPFLVLEHMSGETIDVRLKREGPFTLKALVPFVSQILMGIRDCHAINVLHRDIKPANVFLQQTEGLPTAKIIDFGLARIKSGHGSLTSPSHVLGSIGYMAPEQFLDARNVGPGVDIYAVGCLVFRCLSGQLPFMGKSLELVVRQKCDEDPPLLSSLEGMPMIEALDAFLMRSMARDLRDRFRSAKEMLEQWWQIVPALNHAGDSQRPRSDSIPILIEDLALVDEDDIDSGWSEESASGINSPRFETLHGPPRSEAIFRPSPVSRVPPSSTTNVDVWEEIPTVRHDRKLYDLVAKEIELAKKKV